MTNGIVTYSSLGHYGRFANGLFQICSVIGIARKNGFEYRFPKFINYDHRDRFGSTEDIDVYKHFEHEVPEWTGEPYTQRFVHWGFHDVLLNSNTDITGHLQSDKYFNHCMDEVKWAVIFKDEPEQCGYVAIHLRAGDYIDDPNAYHPVQQKDYYEKAMNHFGSEQKFLVFSDDKNKAMSMLGNGRVEYYNGRDYIDDFKKMKSCSGFIIANSSYSLLAAILSESKQIICPSKWFGPVAGLDTKDLYPEGSTVI